MTTSMPSDISRHFPWSTLLSVTLHGLIIGGLLYLSVHRVVEQPAGKPAQVISVSMVSAAALAPAEPEVQKPVQTSEPQPQPEPVPEQPKAAPVVIEKPKPKPKPKPKSEPKKEIQKQPVKTSPKPTPRPATQSSPFSAAQTQRPPAQAASPAASAPQAPSAAVSSGPHPVSRAEPGYPPRAFSLRIEGRVVVRFDVDASGSVTNVQIVSATPRNMFEREVKQAMRKWRYESGKPASGIVVNIAFKINGGSKVE